MIGRPASVALTAAVLMSALCGFFLLVDSVAPDDLGHPWPATTGDAPWDLRVTLAGLVVSWCVAAMMGVALLSLRQAGADTYPLSWATAAVLLSPFTVGPLVCLLGHPRLLLACVPTTAFGLLAVYRMQRHYRMPSRVLLAGFAWGTLIATGFGSTMNLFTTMFGYGYVIQPTKTLDQINLDALPDLSQINDMAGRTTRSMGLILSLSAGVFEELGKGAGVGIICLLCWRWIHSIGSGVVVGAAVGLGFNMVESVEYMVSATEFQFWMRQSFGLMAGHLAFTAMIGAAFGAARRLDRHTGIRVIGLGITVAVCAHFGTNASLPYLSWLTKHWFDPGPTVNALLMQPLILVVLEGPFVAMYVLVLWRSTRDETQILTAELDAEAHTGLGAVAPGEVPVLLNPIGRLATRIWAFRTGAGLDGYRHVGALQNAQLELALQRSHAHDGVPENTEPLVHALRQQISRLKLEPPLAIRHAITTSTGTGS